MFGRSSWPFARWRPAPTEPHRAPAARAPPLSSANRRMRNLAELTRRLLGGTPPKKTTTDLDTDQPLHRSMSPTPPPPASRPGKGAHIKRLTPPVEAGILALESDECQRRTHAGKAYRRPGRRDPQE